MSIKFTITFQTFEDHFDYFNLPLLALDATEAFVNFRYRRLFANLFGGFMGWIGAQNCFRPPTRTNASLNANGATSFHFKRDLFFLTGALPTSVIGSISRNTLYSLPLVLICIDYITYLQCLNNI